MAPPPTVRTHTTFLVMSFGDVLRFAGARSASGTMAPFLSSLREHIYLDFLLRLWNSWSRSTYTLVAQTRLEFNIPISSYRLLHMYKTTNDTYLGFVYTICWRSNQNDITYTLPICWGNFTSLTTYNCWLFIAVGSFPCTQLSHRCHG